MREFWLSVLGSAGIGGIVTAIANSEQFNQHWNFFVVSGILFVVYWLIRISKGDAVDGFDIDF